MSARKPYSRASPIRVEVQSESITAARTVWRETATRISIRGQGWRNNQNQNIQNNQGYGWRNNQNNMQSNRTSETPSEKKLDLEQALAHMLTSHSTFMTETKANNAAASNQLNNQAAQLRSLEAQMAKWQTC